MSPRTLDVGCGFINGIHMRRGEIGIDLRRGECDIVADAQYLPFRKKVFGKIYLYAILEHLENPMLCLQECLRVAKDDASFEIRIPMEAHSERVDLQRFLLGFPISLFFIVRGLRRRRKFGSLVGFRHKNQIQPSHVARLLKLAKLEVHRRKHLWFANPIGRFVERSIGISFPLLDAGNWQIGAIKPHERRRAHKC